MAGQNNSGGSGDGGAPGNFPPQVTTVGKKVTLDNLLNKVSNALIETNLVNPSIIKGSQKAVRQGQVTGGGPTAFENTNLLSWPSNEDSIKHDFNVFQGVNNKSLEMLESIVDNLNSFNVSIKDVQVHIDSPPDGSASGASILLTHPGSPTDIDITDYLSRVELITLPDGSERSTIRPLNVSQFVNIEQKNEEFINYQADEYLNTEIFELLPDKSIRQKRIDEFFQEFQILSGETPNFDLTNDGLVGNFTSSNYAAGHDIAYIQNNPGESTIQEKDSFITRLDEDDNEVNEGKTLESLRNTLNNYLVDIDQQDLLPEDGRPLYENKSDGYLSFREPNQGIIIRNLNDQYIQSLNPDPISGQTYLNSGFTITMWVRFLDKTSDGTLFNFGNPTRSENPFGFKLETLISGGKRYIKLSVKDIRGEGTNPIANKLYTSEMPNVASSGMEYHMLPENFNEWYFICATYNPEVDENGSDSSNSNIDYWNGNINSDGDMVHYSGLGNRCKLEFISRTDLLRARGYKTE